MAKSAAKKAANRQAQAAAPVIQAAIQAAVQAVEEEPTSKYRVLYPVSHDNDPYKPGEEIYLTEEHAQPLLALKVIVPIEEAK